MNANAGRLGLTAKLTLLMLVLILFSVLMAGVAYGLYEHYADRRAQYASLQRLADTTAGRLSAEKSFDQPRSATEILAALAGYAHIATACVAARSGAVLAIYRRDPGAVCTPTYAADGIESDDRRMLVSKQLPVDGQPRAELRISADMQPLNERVNRIILIVLPAILTLLIIVPLVSRRLQKWLIRPILEVSDAAATVARGQHCSVRIGKHSDDELGRLADAFNAMLETLEMHNRRQSQDHRLLEAQIAERTAALEQAQASLLRQERLATLGKLTGTVSHELRNPLGTIQTSIDVLRNNLTECAPDVDRALRRMERNIHRCESIINELLDFSRGSPPHLQRVQTDVWLHDILAGYVRPLCVECERIDAVSVEFDPERLRRAVLNVLDNAWQACSERQTAVAVAPCVRISLRAEAARLEIVIADNGAGMTADVLARVFEPLFSTRAFGVGLGLAIVKQILQQHGGGVELDSVPEQGTRVCLWLPWREGHGHADH